MFKDQVSSLFVEQDASTIHATTYHSHYDDYYYGGTSTFSTLSHLPLYYRVLHKLQEQDSIQRDFTTTKLWVIEALLEAIMYQTEASCLTVNQQLLVEARNRHLSTVSTLDTVEESLSIRNQLSSTLLTDAISTAITRIEDIDQGQMSKLDYLSQEYFSGEDVKLRLNNPALK